MKLFVPLTKSEFDTLRNWRTPSGAALRTKLRQSWHEFLPTSRPHRIPTCVVQPNLGATRPRSRVVAAPNALPVEARRAAWDALWRSS